MKTIRFLKQGLGVAMLCSMATLAVAEEAPVYDIDNFPPQFDNQSEANALMKSATKDQAQAEQMYAPPQNQNQSLNQRVDRLEQQLNNLAHTDATSKMNDLNAQLQTLRGQVEELSHQVQQMQSQQKSMYSDLDKRLSRKSATNANVADAGDEAVDEVPSDTIKPKAKSKNKLTKQDDAIDVSSSTKQSETKAGDQPNVAEEQQIYQTAYNLIKAKKYNQAADTLQKMLKKYPSGQFAANAHYWLGELYGLMSKNDQALAEFDNVVKNYPDSPKVADAQLKIGLLNAAQLKWSEAKSAFKKVINHYPGTSWARLASEQLKQLKQAGH